MRRHWTNLILHTTAVIYRKKNNLLISHALKSILDVFIIVFLELFLVIISFPLYLVSKGGNTGDNSQYKIRRILTLSSLIVILIVWLIKLVLIVGAPLYFDFRQASIASVKKEYEPVSEQSYSLPDVYGAQIDTSITPPIVENLKEINNNLIMSGRGDKDTKIVVNIGKKQGDNAIEDSNIKIYIANTDENGYWSLETDINNFQLQPGKYWLQVMAYNDETGKKSAISSTEYFEIDQSLYERILSRADKYLNYFVICFIALGIISIILLI